MKTLLLVSACAFVPVVACVGYWIVNPPYGSDSAAMQAQRNINALPLDRWGRQAFGRRLHRSLVCGRMIKLRRRI